MRVLRLAVFVLPAVALPLLGACGSTDPVAAPPASGAGAGGVAGAATKGGSGGAGTGAAAGSATAGTAGAVAGGAAGTNGDMTGFGGSSIAKGGAGGASAGSSGASAGSSGASAGSGGASAAGGTSGGGAAGASGSSSGLSGSSGAAGSAGATAGGAGGGDGGAAGAPSGGAGGAAGTGTSGGAAGLGGAGGSSGTECGAGSPPCAAGSYCDEDQHVCHSCSDLREPRFGAPVSRLAPTASRGDLAFPRVSAFFDGRVLSFRARPVAAAQDDIFAVTLAANGTPGGAVNVSCCVNKAASDSGALLLPGSITGATLGAVSNHGDITSNAAPFFLVDSRRDFDLVAAGGGRNPTSGSSTSRRRIHIAQWDTFPADPDDQSGYGPVPLLNTGLDDFSVAFAHAAQAGAQRFYWMSTRGTPEATSLRTVVLGQTGADSKAVAVTLQGCGKPVSAADFRPWLTPDGTRLIFDAACDPASDVERLWITKPNADGTLPPATPLSIAGDLSASGDTNGSLSPDKCELWFMRGGDIHSAARRLSRNPFVALLSGYADVSK